MKARHLLFAALLLTVSFVTIGCEPSSGEIASPESALSIQSTCLKPGNDPAASWPWEATFPLAQQHVFCQHIVTETSYTTWPAGFSACVGDPGSFQVDFWVRDGGSNPNWRCSRVDVPHPGSAVTWHIAYTEVMMLGWLSSYPRWIGWIELGSGTNVLMSALQDVNASGCVPSSFCVGGAVHQNQPATWIQLDNVLTTSSIVLGPTT